MKNVLKSHWPEYLIEAWALGIFMISACLFTALLELPASSVHQAFTNTALRRGIVGLAMGLTAVALIYSPWGKRSGAHMNPAVTWTFWRLGKIKTMDAVFYTLFQFLGGWLGVVISAVILGSAIADPHVAFVVTIPGPGGATLAWAAEFAISFLLMATILYTANRQTLASETGLFAGALIALYVLIEAPLSGMSMNPARTLGSAIPARVYDHLWIYFTAPLFGMLAAAEVYKQLDHRIFCAKLVHDKGRRCLFCGHSAA